MKYTTILLLAALLAGCSKNKRIEITADIPGVSTGGFVIKDKDGNQVFSETILGGKMDLKGMLQQPGYYDMFITPDVNHDTKKKLFEVYLEGGTYNITSSADKLYLYPQIKTESKIQNAIAEYYGPATQLQHDAEQKASNLYDMVYGQSSNVVVMSGEYNRLLNELNKANDEKDHVQGKAFEDYVNKHPQSEVEAHIMTQLDYRNDPVVFYRAYQKFNDAQKQSADGKAIGDELQQLAKLAPGAIAPPLVGKTPEGKAFDQSMLKGKKAIIVQFWQSDSKLSRSNNEKFAIGFPDFKGTLGVVSVSADTKQDDWLKAVKEDKLQGVNISDLKGNDSPNMTKWSVSTMPTYDVLDATWHIVKRDVPFDSLDVVLKAHFGH